MKYSFKTEFPGFGVEFSPYDCNYLAIATSSDYSLSADSIGRLYISKYDPTSMTQSIITSADSRSPMIDLSWSESNFQQIIVGCGDGNVLLYDFPFNDIHSQVKVCKYINNGHANTVNSVDWNPVSKLSFISSASDGQTKLWNIEYTHPVNTYYHNDVVNASVWSPLHAESFVSVNKDSFCSVFDIRGQNPSISFRSHNVEALTCDWSKYDMNTLATASADGEVRIWDLRNTVIPLSSLSVHRYGIRRIKFSPHYANCIATVSYDMNVIIHPDPISGTAPRHCMFNHHTEFVTGIDFNLFERDNVVSCGFDNIVFNWQWRNYPDSVNPFC